MHQKFRTLQNTELRGTLSLTVNNTKSIKNNAANRKICRHMTLFQQKAKSTLLLYSYLISGLNQHQTAASNCCSQRDFPVQREL